MSVKKVPADVQCFFDRVKFKFGIKIKVRVPVTDRMGNHAESANVRCALWMMRAVFSLSDLGPRRLSVRSMSLSCPL